MLKTVILVATGIVIGVIATLISDPPRDAPPTENSPDTTRLSDGRTEPTPVRSESSSSYEALETENEELFDLVVELETVLREIRDSTARNQAEAAGPTTNLPYEDRAISQLVAAGFTQEQAESIIRRDRELRLENAQSQFTLESYARSPEALLRNELGDAEYEKLLRATGQEPSVGVGTVDETSPAAIAGLTAGDRIVSYNGNRVFDVRELIALSLQETPAVAVIVDIVRNRDSMQLIVPGGPIEAELFSGDGVRAAPNFFAAPSFVREISNGQEAPNNNF